MKISNQLKEGTKVVGYFSYIDKEAFCDGDACIISGSEELMRRYLNKVSNGQNFQIKKTRFNEIIKGLSQAGAYAFDEESYDRFFQLARINGIELPVNDIFLDAESTE